MNVSPAFQAFAQEAPQHQQAWSEAVQALGAASALDDKTAALAYLAVMAAARLDSGLPFVIPGVPQFITMGVFAILILFLVNWALDYKGIARILQARRERGKSAALRDGTAR